MPAMSIAMPVTLALVAIVSVLPLVIDGGISLNLCALRSPFGRAAINQDGSRGFALTACSQIDTKSTVALFG